MKVAAKQNKKPSYRRWQEAGMWSTVWMSC